MLKNYIKIAWRNLRRNKGFSLFNAIGLAIGLASLLTIALWVQDELKYDKFHLNSSQLYQVMANTYEGSVSTTDMAPASLNAALKAEVPEVAYVTTFVEKTALLSANNTSFKENGGYATPDILKMFTFPLTRGNPETALSAPGNIIITERLADKYFSSADPIGQTITLDNNTAFRVSGVLKDIPSASTLKFDWLIPFEVYEKGHPVLANWGSFSVSMYVMLKPNVLLTAVNNKLQHFLQTKTDETNKDELFLQPFTDRYLHAHFENGQQAGGRIEYVQLFSVIAVFILFIACINFVNLSTARATERAKEIGVRKVVGAQRQSIIAQFISEATIVTVVAFGIALLLVWLGLPYFNQLTSKTLYINLTDPQMGLFIVGTFITTVLLSGGYPALYWSAFKPMAIFKAQTLKNNIGAFFRKGLVVVQFTIAVVLVIGTLVVFRQIQYIKNKNTGLDRENRLVIPVTGDIYNHLPAFQEELSRLPSIVSSTTSWFNPINIEAYSGDLEWPGKLPEQAMDVSVTMVGYDFLKTLGIPLVAGRDFQKGRPDSTVRYLINETTAARMGVANPTGMLVSFWMGTGEIIGVVKDFHLHSLHDPITPLIICLEPGNAGYVIIRTQAGKTQQAIADIQQVYQKYSPAFPFEYQFMDDAYVAQYNHELIIEKLGYLFAGLAIFIACLGLFGLAAFSAQQRTKEIGIRKVLGASVIGITQLLSKDFLKLVLIGLVIATPIAWWVMTKWLEGFAYRIDISWWIFTLAGLAALLIALLTVSWQAIRAAMANPVESLRDE